MKWFIVFGVCILFLPSVFAAYFFNESFETVPTGYNPVNGWTNITGSPVLENVSVFSGSHSVRFTRSVPNRFINTTQNMSIENATCAVWAMQNQSPTAANQIRAGMFVNLTLSEMIAVKGDASVVNWVWGIYGAEVSTSIPATPNVWYRLAVNAVGNNTLKLYVNGSYVGSHGYFNRSLGMVALGTQGGTTEVGSMYFDDMLCWNGNLTDEPVPISSLSFVSPTPLNGSMFYNESKNYLNINVSVPNNVSNLSINLSGIVYPFNYYCFQEFANVSTICGGLGTGVYINQSLWSDGDYDSKTDVSPSSSYWVNYSIPVGVYGALWQIKDQSQTVLGGVVTNFYNVSIPFDCRNSSRLSLRIDSAFAVGGGWSYYCLNGSNYYLLSQSITQSKVSGVGLFEEAVIWSVYPSSFYQNFTGLGLGSYSVEASGFNSSGQRLSSGVNNYLFFNSLYNFTLTNSSGGAIPVFGVSLLDRFTFLTSLYNASGGFVRNVPLVQGREYDVVFDAPNYSVVSQRFNASLYGLINLSALLVDAVYVNVFNESDGLPILNRNLSFRFNNLTTEFNRSLSNGSAIFVLGAGTWDVLVSDLSGVFTSRYYNLVIPSRGAYNLSVYLLDVSNAFNGSVLLNVRSTGGNPIEGVLCEMYAFVLGNKHLVESKLSDVTGALAFQFESGEVYSFTCSKDGFLDNVFELNPIQFTSMSVTMQTDSSLGVVPTGYFSYKFNSPFSFYNGMNNTMNFTFVSPNMGFQNYYYQLTYPSGSLSGYGVNPSGQGFSGLVTLPATTALQYVNLTYWYILDNGEVVNNTETFVSYPQSLNKTFVKMGTPDYDLKIGDKVLIIVLLLAIIMGSALLVSVTVSIFAGLFVLSIFTLNGWLGDAGVAIFTIPSILLVGYVVLRAWYTR